MGKKGYTLTELLVVIAILAISVTVAVPVISSITGKAGMSADSVTAQSIETAIDSWMNTDYADDNFFRTNLYTSASTEPAARSRIGGYTEQLYSYNFAGTRQLPGVELINESEIRHSVICAIKATSHMKIDERGGEQFIEPPEAGAQYGFKYYYKIGKVNAERTDSTTSALGNDEVYRYYVWLDRQGGSIDSTTVPKQYKNTESLSVLTESLCSLVFDYSGGIRADYRITVKQEGMLSYTFDAVSETPRMFKPGIYTVVFYVNGDEIGRIESYTINSTGQVIAVP